MGGIWIIMLAAKRSKAERTCVLHPLACPVSARWAVPRITDSPVEFDRIRPFNSKIYTLGVRAIERLCIKHLQTHTHVTRHSFSHAMIKAGATLPELQDRLGHSSLHTTGIYAKVFTGAKNPHARKLAAMFGIEE